MADCGCRGFKTSRSLLGPPFIWENMHMEGLWSLRGILVASRAFSLAWLSISLCVPVLFGILADPGPISWLLLCKTHWLKTKHVLGRNVFPPPWPPVHSESRCSVHPLPEASPDWERRRGKDRVNSSSQTLREMSLDSHQTGAGAPSTEVRCAHSCCYLPCHWAGCGGVSPHNAESVHMWAC